MNLNSSRLLFSPINLAHIDEWYELSQDSGLTLFQISNYKMSDKTESKNWIEQQLQYLERNRIGTIGVFEKVNGKLIGICGLKYLDKEKDSDVEIMYRLSQSSWGKGYATEICKTLIEHAKESLLLKKLVATVDATNIASKNVLKKTGFVFIKYIEIQGISEELYELKLN